MLSNYVKSVLSCALVTSFAMNARAQQSAIAPSQSGTVKLRQWALPLGLKNLPLILDSKNLNVEKFRDPKVEKSNTPDGPRTGGGGNACAMNVTKATVLIKDNLDNVPFDAKQREDFLEKIKNVLFLQGANLEVNDQYVNAINYPAYGVIVLDQKACDYLGEENVYGYALLLHEYLGVAGIDDRTYQLSGTFSKRIKELVSAVRDCGRGGGSTAFQEATSVSCVLKNFNDNQSEKTVIRQMKRSEGGMSAVVFAVGSFKIEADSYSINACNEGDFLFVTDKKSSSVFSTKSGQIAFRSSDGKINYGAICTFIR